MTDYLNSYGVSNPECSNDAQLFLSALGEALQRGEYYLKHRYTSTAENGSGLCIGLYDDDEIILRCSEASKLWARASGRSAYSARHLWEAFKAEGLGGESTRAIINGCAVNARRLNRKAINTMMSSDGL